MKNTIKVCPHCQQKMMVYRRSIRLNMIQMLDKQYKIYGFEPKLVSDLSEQTVKVSDYPKLRYWELIERVDGNKYQVTQRGRAFLLGELRIPKYVWIYNQVRQVDMPFEQEYIYAWDIAPEVISKETVLRDARAYGASGEKQESFV